MKKLPLFFHCKRVIDVQNCGRGAWYSRQRKYGILKRFSEDKCSLRMNEVKFWIEFWYAAHRGGKKRKSDDRHLSKLFTPNSIYHHLTPLCAFYLMKYEEYLEKWQHEKQRWESFQSFGSFKVSIKHPEHVNKSWQMWNINL